MEALGSRTYFLTRFPPAMDPSRMPERIRTRKYIEYSYEDYIRQAAPDIEIVTTVGTRGFFLGDSNMITSGDRSVEKVIVRGAEPQYTEADSAVFDRARPLHQQHRRRARARRGGIGRGHQRVALPRFRSDRQNGAHQWRLVRSDRRFGTIGLFLGPGVDIFAIIPLSNFKKEYPGSKELVMAFTVPKGVNIDVAQGEVIQAMRRLRKVPADKDNDFELSSPDFLSNLWNQLTGALVILTTVISSIGLLVGGIGVMNIMLISVTERTQEIGVRKAIGARRADIRLQFLLEAVVLTLVGGTIGILIGAGVSTLVRTLAPSIPATLSYLWVTIGSVISVGVGLFFGYYPASLAANLDPIDCLRYE